MKGLMKLMSANKKYKPSISNVNAIPKKWKITRGDDVVVNAEHLKCFGERGVVKQVMRDVGRVVVEGVNMGVRRVKANPNKGIKGGNVMVSKSLHYSNVNLADPVTGQATKIARKWSVEQNKMLRVSKVSGAIIPRAEILSVRRKPKSNEVGPSDTDNDDAWERTYFGIGAKGKAAH